MTVLGIIASFTLKPVREYLFYRSDTGAEYTNKTHRYQYTVAILGGRGRCSGNVA